VMKSFPKSHYSRLFKTAKATLRVTSAIHEVTSVPCQL